jgi:uncharacterized membrane protein YfcA
MVDGPLLFAAAILAGAIAAVSGFGIGSVLVPILALQTGSKAAIVIVSVPHLFATGIRFAMLRREVAGPVFRRFGLMSAGGGLVGAVLHAYTPAAALTTLFSALLLFVGVLGLTGSTERFRMRGWMAWAAGLGSGVLGGLVGNQGGIRTAALLGFGLTKEAFVATGTAVGLIIDAARMPVYALTEPQAMTDHPELLILTTSGAIAGTFLGHNMLRRMPEALYRPIVSLLLIGLGVWMLLR